MSEYMKWLKNEVGYMSLKEKFDLEMARIYGRMEADTTVTPPEDIDKYVSENWEDLDLRTDAEINCGIMAVPHKSPIQQRDEIIASLEKQVQYIFEIFEFAGKRKKWSKLTRAQGIRSH